MMNPIKTKSVIVIFLTIALTLGMASTAMSLTGKKVDRRHPAIGQVFLTNQYKDPPSEHIELTGVLISPNTVLVGVQWGAWLVFNDQHTKPDREFDWFFKVGGKIYRVAAIESSGKSSNEMSILRLKRNVKKIKPMPLCQAHHDLKKLNLLFVGYNASKPSKDYKI